MSTGNDSVDRAPRILGLSARGPEALRHTAEGLAAFLHKHAAEDLDDVAMTLARGREQFEYRQAVVATDRGSAITALTDPGEVVTAHRGRAPATPSRTVFAFSGQGSQYTGMAAEAYTAFPEFRRWLDHADAVLRGVLPVDLLRCLSEPGHADVLGRTDVAAVAITAVQLGLVRVLERFGVMPEAVIGHSVGEFGAAVVAGCLEPEDALCLVARRGALMVELTEPGAMVSVRCAAAGADTWDADAVAALAERSPGIGIAVRNGPRDLVLSGTLPAVAAIQDQLEQAGLRARRLHVSHAFHSDLLLPMRDGFAEAVAAIEWGPPTSTEWVSCSRGTLTSAPDAEYWVDHLLAPVNFGTALASVCAGTEEVVLLEIGPHPVLLPLAGELPKPPVLVPVLSRDRDAAVAVVGAVAHAWCHGVRADLTGARLGRRRHVPGYAFDRRVHSARAVGPNGTASPRPTAAAQPPSALPDIPAREHLAALWKDLLGSEPESDSGFISSGGDSLTLLRLQQRLQEAIGAGPQLPSLAALLDAGTFEGMARLLPAEPAATETDAAPGANPALNTTPETAGTGGLSAQSSTVTYQPSATQQGMLLLDMMQPNSNQHNVTLAVRIAGRVDRAAMAESFLAAQRRHAALRTTFTRRGARFAAQISPEPGAELIMLDTRLPAVGSLADDTDEREWARKLSQEPIRCTDDPPVRGALVLGEDRSVLVITAHHAVSDATSMGVLLEELADDYNRTQRGEPRHTISTQVQFHQLREELHRAEHEEADRRYWLAQLDGAPDLIPIPTDHTRPAVRAGAGAHHTTVLDAPVAGRARALAGELRVTLFSVMLTAFAALLNSRSGADDLSIGTPATGRLTPGSERVFGPLLNTVVLRVNIGENQRFGDLVQDVQRTVVDAIQHSGYAFDHLVTELTRRRDPGTTPLFSVMFTMPAQFGLPTFGGFASTAIELPGLGAKYDLTLYVTPASEGGLRLDFEYDPALFEESTIHGLADEYRATVSALSLGGSHAIISSTTADNPIPHTATAPAGGVEVAREASEEVRDYVAGVWSDVLGVTITDPATDFFDVGGHSMLALACLAEFQERHPELTIEDFFVHRTLGAFAAHVTAVAGGGSATQQPAAGPDPSADTPPPSAATTPRPDLEPTEPSAPSARPSAISASADATDVGATVLLTGATGFLGAHLLAGLLRRQSGSIACPVRGSSGVTGQQRLEQSVARYAPSMLAACTDRVVVLDADLRDWDPDAADSALTHLELVIHSAADVRMYGQIEDFRAANVTPTRRLAELALARGSRFAYISTASSVGARPGDGAEITVSESDFDRGEEFDNPYSQSKFEAEKAVRHLIAAGLNATVHRVGGLVGDSVAGTFVADPRSNLLYGMLQSFLRCGLVPDASGFSLNLTPVDFAAEAVLRLSDLPSASGGTFHVMNPRQLTMRGLTGILHELGYPAVLAEPQRIVTWLSRPEAPDTDKQALPFLRALTSPPATVVHHDTTATMNALTDLQCPPPDIDLMHTLIGHGIATGFFPEPQLWGFVSQNSVPPT